ncbi:CIA30 family protein [Prosthecochloris sp. GSB1]|uniref:CIA30 family protein n=1 Tax=Prosthecochloris sp. GSB1 TaxID=281093 RepID=UPI000B8CD024|nr:CIA30 family protein [Prosthecochloris sp. GSB1]ASQ90830.1 CIA30 family protein [Prosthecochloris sp. GSB1]
MERDGKILCDFTAPPMMQWSSVDDVVMGGVSESLMSIDRRGVGIFSGHLSLENNGGFASVRTILPQNDYAGCTGVLIRVRGDGKTYSFRIRNDLMFDGVVYRYDFPTEAEKWINVRMPFDDFQPSFRGRSVPGAPPLDPSRLFQIGFLISQKQEGDFRLEVERIEGYGE